MTWLTVKVRVWVAKLRTDQTVGSSVMKARVVTVSGVTWTSSFLTLSGVKTMEEWDRYRLGHRAVGVLARSPRLNVQSGPSGPKPGFELGCVGTTP